MYVRRKFDTMMVADVLLRYGESEWVEEQDAMMGKN